MSGLPKGWVAPEIGDLCALQNGKAFKPSDWATTGTPIIRIQNLNNKNSTFNYFNGDIEQKFEIKNEDLLFAWSGTPGTSFGAHIWDGGRAVLNQHIFRIDFDELNIHKPYFRYAINQKLDQLINQAHGGVGLAHVTKGKFERTQIALPPLPEQRRIVAKIESLAARSKRARADLTRVERLVETAKQAVLAAAFRGELTADWRRGRNTESADELIARTAEPEKTRGGREATRDLKVGHAGLSINHPGTPAPNRWSWVPLRRIARQETGHTPSRLVASYWDGGIPWIGIRDAGSHHGREIFETRQTISQQGLDNSSARLLPAGTVCLSRTASVGYVTIMGRTMATSQDFATWTCTDALIPKFLMYALMAEGENIKEFGEGTTHTTIYFPEIRALHICLAPLPEQHEIVRRIETAFAHLDALAAEAKKAVHLLNRLDQAVLAKAFRGELVPQDPDDEPADVLLARIRAERAAAGTAKGKAKAKAGPSAAPPPGANPGTRPRRGRPPRSA